MKRPHEVKNLRTIVPNGKSMQVELSCWGSERSHKRNDAEPTRWQRTTPGLQANTGDASFTLTTLTDSEQLVHSGTLTANRTITLSSTNAYQGAKFRVTRTGGGAFTLSVGGLKSLSTGQWADVAYDGAAWLLVGYGAL